MKNLTLITASIAFVIIALLLWAQAAEHNTLHILQNAGFNKPAAYNSHKSFGAVHLKNIILDTDEASTIKSLKSSFSLKNNATILMDGLDLTGDTLEDVLAISGFKQTNNLAALRLDKAIINNARLALLTQQIGGLNINFNALLTRENKDTLSLQTRLSSKQRNLTFGAQAKGTIAPNQWAFGGTIEHLKFTTPCLLYTSPSPRD